MSYFDTGQPPEKWSARPPLAAILTGTAVAVVGSLVLVYGAAVLIGFLNDELVVAFVGWAGFAAGLFVRFLGGWVTAWMAARRFRRETGDPRWTYSGLTAVVGAAIGYVVFELAQIAMTVVLTGSLPGPSAGTFLNVFGWVIPAAVGALMCAMILRLRERDGGRTPQAPRYREGPYRDSW